MPEEREQSGGAATGESPAYEAPVVDDLENVDGPAVTAAGASPT
jgi:hypothetical protein